MNQTSTYKIDHDFEPDNEEVIDDHFEEVRYNRSVSLSDRLQLQNLYVGQSLQNALDGVKSVGSILYSFYSPSTQAQDDKVDS